jgi:hypothetical protein
MITPLDPDQLTTSASLNRLQIMDLPGIDPAVRGKRGYDLLSTQRLLELLKASAEILHLPADVPDYELPILFDRCFGDPHTAPAAESIAREMGRNLGYILLTLKRGDPVNRAARIDWDNSYWDYWAQIQKIWLGGGLVSGKLGVRMHYIAQEMLAQDGFADVQVLLSHYGSNLPLVGAARRLPGNSTYALVFDFGQTRVKRAIAYYTDGILTALRTLSTVPSGCETLNPSADNRALAERQRDTMVNILADVWGPVDVGAGAWPELAIAASIASYMRDGQPADRGCYGQLGMLSDNLENHLAKLLSQKIHKPVNITLIHDGTAAATAYAGSPHTAVIMIGTALGIGFPTMKIPVRPIPADSVKIVVHGLS